MRKLFLVLILISTFFSSGSCEILVNSPYSGEPLEVLIEGAENGTVILIRPDGRPESFFLLKGYARIPIDTPGKWAIEYLGERKEIEIETLDNEYSEAPDGKKKDMQMEIVIFGTAVASILIATMIGIWLVYFGPSEKREPRFCGNVRNGKVVAFFESGSRPIENLRITCDEKKIFNSKRIDAFERIEIERETGITGMKLRAEYVENGKLKRIGYTGGHEHELMEREQIGKRKLERV